MTRSAELERILAASPPFAIAVSGGVDSMTLALVAHRVRDDVQVYHAVSPAVPPRATQRVRQYAAAHEWQLHEVRAGEFDDRNYIANPYNRCYFCKLNLYDEIGRHTKRLIVSGTNVDDMSDYRPGLEAAGERSVRHPFVEARLTKDDVRAIAVAMGASALSQLPASPCLSSRIETGIEIDAETLTAVDDVEIWLAQTYAATTVRCRVRRDAITIELDNCLLGSLGNSDMALIRERVRSRFPGSTDVRILGYRMGSAFVPPSTST